ncbi:hypothetical protein [Streptomyces chartreusis]|uniref:hypothetical protein n=1 Tax=Streptomyces chartreusis TaxID=1969 RepID=UPI002E81F085|nr:hypothetical protein [Streptomyces chartreusis]WUB15339.1 hypothetical protein OG997_00935 [Streptomyces chartreusis]
MNKTFAMSQDFAAISAATMAALLILVATELAASANQQHAQRLQLLVEHGAAIRASFDEFFSGTPLPPKEKRGIERELHRFRTRRTSHDFEVLWRGGYGLAAFMCIGGLALVLRWSALAEQPKGYHTATYTLVAIGGSGVLLFGGFCWRQMAQNRHRRIEWLLRTCVVLGVPDAQDARRMWLHWLVSDTGGGVFDVEENPLDLGVWKYVRRHSPKNFR